MKRILLSIALLCSAYLSAQTLIADEKYEKKNAPVNFEYLPKSQKFVVYRGENISISQSTRTINALTFDLDGKKSTLFENENLNNVQFSRTENSFVAFDTSTSLWGTNYKFFVNNASSVVTKETVKDIGFSYFMGYDHNNVLYASMQYSDESGRIYGAFNDSSIFGFSNQEHKSKIELEKDDIFLEVIDFKNSSKKRFQIEKPDLTLLMGDSFAKTEHKLNFTCKLNGNENFDLITKSISKDFQTVIIYKSTYDFDGKKLKTLPITLKLDNKFFVTSFNGGGGAETSSSPSMQSSRFSNSYYMLDGLSINNFLEDRKNGDMYVYGIFSDQSQKEIGDNIHPKGYYVFKFDKEGKKIWESINYIDGKDFFEKIKSAPKLDVTLVEYNKNLVFSVSVNDFTEFTNASILDKENGKELKKSFLEYNNNMSHQMSKAFINNTYDYKGLKKETFSQTSFAAIILNDNILNYLKSIADGDKRLYFVTVFSEQGIFLVETDNRKYYKVLLFKE